MKCVDTFEGKEFTLSRQSTYIREVALMLEKLHPLLVSFCNAIFLFVNNSSK